MFCSLSSETGMTSPGQKPLQMIRSPSTAQTVGIPSWPCWLGPKECGAIHLEPVWLQKLLKEWQCLASDHLRDFSPDFQSEFTPLAFVSPDSHKSVRPFAHGWGSDSSTPGHVFLPVGLHATCLGARSHLHPLQSSLGPYSGQLPSAAFMKALHRLAVERLCAGRRSLHTQLSFSSIASEWWWLKVRGDKHTDPPPTH